MRPFRDLRILPKIVAPALLPILVASSLVLVSKFSLEPLDRYAGCVSGLHERFPAVTQLFCG